MIELTDVLFYSGGQSGYSRIVGYESGNRRVARYTFTVSELGASGVKLTLRTVGLTSGKAIPLRFFIGSDPESHANAGEEYPYTGELTRGTDSVTFTAQCQVVLLPGKTYYLWVFPVEDVYGYYGWASTEGPSTMEPVGAACVVPVAQNGELKNRLVCAKSGASLLLCAPYVKQSGKMWLLGPG